MTAGQPAASGRLWTSLAEDPTLADPSRASRPAWVVGPDAPAADAMGSAAAALAAAAAVMEAEDRAYSQVLVTAAVHLYRIAASQPGKEQSLCSVLRARSGGWRLLDSGGRCWWPAR